MRIALLILLLFGCRAAEPAPTAQPTVREWLANSDAGREILERDEPIRPSDWQ